MKWKITAWNGKEILECEPASGCVESEQDALDLVAACGEAGCDRLLVDESNLAADFFRLSSGLAGAVFLKLDLYRLRWAALLSAQRAAEGKFGELVAETNRMSSTFRVYQQRQAALDWLASLKDFL